MRLLVVSALSVATAACAASAPWGTPRYFERVVGLAFAPDGPIVECRLEWGMDYAAFRRVRLPAAVTTELRRREPDVLRRHPLPLAADDTRRRFEWRRGPLTADARKALDFALSGASSAIEASKCQGVDTARMRTAVANALQRSATYHAFQFESESGEVVPEALEFRILDLDEGVLYELDDFS
jgi:hypothetical protein